MTEQGEYALLKIKKEFRDKKYSSHTYVAVSLKLSTSKAPRYQTRGQRQREGVQLIEHLFMQKRRIRTGIMFTQATDEAIEYLFRMAPTTRVTRQQASAALEEAAKSKKK